MSAVILLCYFLFTLILGAAAGKKSGKSASDYYLAGRRLSTPFLFFTMAATNFSAFTIFGLSGAGYRIGYAFFPVMGYATGFMALSFFLVGTKMMLLSSRKGFITPGDYIRFRYGSENLKLLFTGFLILFTLPYIAIQTIAGGKAISTLTGIPYTAASGMLIIAVFIYVLLGGMQSIVWTDVFQGILILGLTIGGYIVIVRAGGGLRNIHQQLLNRSPAHLSRPGAGTGLGVGVWFGYFMLWFFADPMFPHLFQRFMAGKNQKALMRTAVIYPLITTALFFLTVSVGALGKALLPGLPDSQSDTIFPRLLLEYSGPAAASLLMIGGIAALMSTLDSQLLTVTSLITQDLPGPKKVTNKNWRCWVLAFLAGAGFLIAVFPPETILDFINATTFNGLAVLAPSVIGGLYWKRGNRYGAGASIIIGELGTAFFFLGNIRIPGIMPVIILVPVSAAAYIIGSLLTTAHPLRKTDSVFTAYKKITKKGRLTWGLIFALLLFSGIDFWNWNRVPKLFLGLPLWIWYFFGLGILLSFVFAVFSAQISRKR